VDAFSNCNKEEKMIREPFETMTDVIDVKQIAQALHLSRAGAYNLMPPRLSQRCSSVGTNWR